MMPHPENHVEAVDGLHRRPRAVRGAGRAFQARRRSTSEWIRHSYPSGSKSRCERQIRTPCSLYLQWSRLTFAKSSRKWDANVRIGLLGEAGRGIDDRTHQGRTGVEAGRGRDPRFRHGLLRLRFCDRRTTGDTTSGGFDLSGLPAVVLSSWCSLFLHRPAILAGRCGTGSCELGGRSHNNGRPLASCRIRRGWPRQARL